MGYIKWGGKKFYPQSPKPYKPDINELMKPLSEKVGKGNVWGSVIMKVPEETGGAPVSPTPTPSVTPTMTVTPTITPTKTTTPTPTVTPTKTPTPTPSPQPFSPSQFTNIWDWWTSDSGVELSTTTTNGVTGWTGYYGNKLLSNSNTYLPQYNSSDATFNNEPSILINSGATSTPGIIDGSFEINVSTSATSKTFLFVGYLDTVTSGDDNRVPIWAVGVLQQPRFGLFQRTDSSNIEMFYNVSSDVLTQTGSTYGNGKKYFSRGTYDRSVGTTKYYGGDSRDFELLLGTQTPGTNLDFTSGKLTICGYDDFYSDSPKMRIVDMVFIDGIPTSQELTDYENYILNKYNI